jgi:hypothetical protein
MLQREPGFGYDFARADREHAARAAAKAGKCGGGGSGQGGTDPKPSDAGGQPESGGSGRVAIPGDATPPRPADSATPLPTTDRRPVPAGYPVYANFPDSEMCEVVPPMDCLGGWTPADVPGGPIPGMVLAAGGGGGGGGGSGVVVSAPASTVEAPAQPDAEWQGPTSCLSALSVVSHSPNSPDRLSRIGSEDGMGRAGPAHRVPPAEHAARWAPHPLTASLFASDCPSHGGDFVAMTVPDPADIDPIAQDLCNYTKFPIFGLRANVAACVVADAVRGQCYVLEYTADEPPPAAPASSSAGQAAPPRARGGTTLRVPVQASPFVVDTLTTLVNLRKGLSMPVAACHEFVLNRSVCKNNFFFLISSSQVNESPLPSSRANVCI